MRILVILVTLWTVLYIGQPALAVSSSHSSNTVKAKSTTHKKIKKKQSSRIKKRVKKKKNNYYSMPSVIRGNEDLNYVINRIVASDAARAKVSVMVKSMAKEDKLYQRNVNTSLVPASTLKIFTAEAALLYLGSDYRFSTQILTNAKDVEDGVLQGNIYIVLSGDPTLKYEELEELVLAIKDRDIQAVAGNVYIDDTAYDQGFYGPGWEGEDKEYCYAAPIGASIINHNCLPFQIKASTVLGRKAKIVKSPKYFYPKMRNTVVTKKRRSRACSVRLSKEPGSPLNVGGCMPRGRAAWGVSYVVTDIPEYNRSLFKSLIAKSGIKVYGNVTFGAASDDLEYISTHSSESLEDLVKQMLKKSDNIIAGAIFKKLGQLYSRRPGSWENGSQAVTNILSRQGGIALSGAKILDGSGLSPNNMATASQLMQLLNFAFHHTYTRYEFISALPIAGVDGTLKNRLKPVSRKVRAKTGTMSGVTSLAGFVETADQEPLAFVIMVNGSKLNGWRYKAMEDKIVTALTRYRRK